MLLIIFTRSEKKKTSSKETKEKISSSFPSRPMISTIVSSIIRNCIIIVVYIFTRKGNGTAVGRDSAIKQMGMVITSSTMMVYLG